MVIDSERSLIIKNALSVLSGSVKALRKDERIVEFLSIFNDVVYSAPISNLRGAIADFKNKLVTDEPPIAYDSFAIMTSRLSLMVGLTELQEAMKQLESDLNTDKFFEPISIPYETSAEIVIVLFRLFNSEIIEPGKVNESS